MKKFFFLGLILICAFARAEQFNFYAVRRDLTAKADLDNVLASGKKDLRQPIRATMILTQPNTNYYVVVNPPQVLIDVLILAGKAQLYQTYTLDNQRMSLTTDNSASVDLKKDWRFETGISSK